MIPLVYFRADGDHEMGLGHLFRCIALGHMLREDFKIVFICKQIPANVKEEVLSASFELQEIRDEGDFLNKLKPGDVVVLDGYQFDLGYQKKIKKNGCKLICIDDLHNQEFVADLIINHAPGVTSDKYQAAANTKFALGFSYMLLRPEFLVRAGAKRTFEKIDSVLICFGGADPQNYTSGVVNCLKDYEDISRIVVVTGASYKSNEELARCVGRDKRIEVLNNLYAGDLAKIMEETDIAIVPASTISIEAFASKMILITGMTADNQENIYRGLVQEDSVMGIGDFSGLSCEILLENVKKAQSRYRHYSNNSNFNVRKSMLEIVRSLV